MTSFIVTALLRLWRHPLFGDCRPQAPAMVSDKGKEPKIYISFIDKKYYARYKCHNYIYTTNTYSTFYRIHFYIRYNSSERFINSLFSSYSQSVHVRIFCCQIIWWCEYVISLSVHNFIWKSLIGWIWIYSHSLLILIVNNGIYIIISIG